MAKARGFLGAAWVSLGEYPGRIPGPGAIGGELLEIPDRDAFVVLDQYERAIGPDPLFRRELVRLIQPEGRLAWVYTWTGRHAGGAAIAMPLA